MTESHPGQLVTEKFSHIHSFKCRLVIKGLATWFFRSTQSTDNFLLIPISCIPHELVSKFQYLRLGLHKQNHIMNINLITHLGRLIWSLSCPSTKIMEKRNIIIFNNLSLIYYLRTLYIRVLLAIYVHSS